MKFKELMKTSLFKEAMRCLNNTAYGKTMFKETALQYGKLYNIDSILNYGVLYATSSEFLNDTKEFKHGCSFFTNRIKDYNNYPIFTTSFTTLEDNLGQYQIYAHEIGIAISYDFNSIRLLPTTPKLSQIIKEKNVEKFYPMEITYPQKVTYENHANAKAIREYKSNLSSIENNLQGNPEAQNELVDILAVCSMFLSSYIKQSIFQAEKEIRFVAPALIKGTEKGYPEISKINFRSTTEKIIKPSIEICYTLPDEKGQRCNIGWPIHTIWIGPGRNQNKAFESVVYRVEYGKVVAFPVFLEEFFERFTTYLSEMEKFVTDSINLICRQQIRNPRKSAEIIANMKCEKEKENENIFKPKELANPLDWTGVNNDNYMTEKNIVDKGIESLLKALVELIDFSELGLKNLVHKYINEFEGHNHFSKYGIWIRCSAITLTFV